MHTYRITPKAEVDVTDNQMELIQQTDALAAVARTRDFRSIIVMNHSLIRSSSKGLGFV